MTKAIFIEWEETEQVFDGWRIVSGLGTEPMFKAVKITRRARFSNEVTKARKAQAKLWVEKDRPGAKVVIREDK